MDSIALMLEDPFDLTTVNLLGDFEAPFCPPSQPQQNQQDKQELLAVVQEPNPNNCNSLKDHNHSRDEGIEDHRRSKASSLPENLGDGDKDNANVDSGAELHSCDKQRKKLKTVMHRDVERQRRQEMASLHASLRCLLPLDYLKGKRSMSDHLDGAVKYITHLKARNQALSNKRDKLKTLQNTSACTTDAPVTNPNSAPNVHHRGQPEKGSLVARRSPQGSDQVVVVKACMGGGVQVLVRVGQEERLPLSMVLKALAQEGLDVTNCTSTNVPSNKWLHCLQAQVGEGRNVDMVELQQKLTIRISSCN